MRERQEGVLPVIVTHAALTHAAKRQRLNRQVDNGIVHHHGPRAGLLFERVLDLLDGAEDVERERLLASVNEVNRLVGVVDRDNGKNWSKYFLLQAAALE